MRLLILASLTISTSLAAQGASPRGSLEQRLTALLDAPPFHRATWGVHAVDERGRVLYAPNADRWFVPASNTKLVVSAAATVLLPADFRARTSLYVFGTLRDGVLEGDLVLYGRGDPSFSTRCYGPDTLAVGACDSATARVAALADSVRARVFQRVSNACCVFATSPYLMKRCGNYGIMKGDFGWQNRQTIRKLPKYARYRGLAFFMCDQHGRWLES